MTCGILFRRGKKPHTSIEKCIEQTRVSFAPKHPAAIYAETRFINPGLSKSGPGTDSLVKLVMIDQARGKACLARTSKLYNSKEKCGSTVRGSSGLAQKIAYGAGIALLVRKS